MADNTKIEWADATVNAINGCSLASPGCTNCYAMKQAHRFPIRQGLTVQSKGGMVWTGEVRLAEEQLVKPLGWRRPRRIFWNAHGDTFHDAVPDEWIDKVFAVCALTPQHTHMILTKRSKRMRAYMANFDTRPEDFGSTLCTVVRAAKLPMMVGINTIDAFSWPLPNVWLGVSVEDQQRADERIPDLLATPAAVRFISAEPLLGPVDLTALSGDRCTIDALDGTKQAGSAFASSPKLDWVIVGGESGPGARPMHPDWARSLRDQCAAAGVAFHFKQWGSCLPGNMDGEDEHGGPAYEIEDVAQPVDYDQLGRGRLIQAHGCDFIWFSHHRTGRLLDGVEHNGMPA